MNAEALFKGLSNFLAVRKWLPAAPHGEFLRYTPPEELGFADDFQLVLPADPFSNGAPQQLMRSVGFMGDVYGLDKEDLALALSEESIVFTTRIRDESAHSGALPLDRFEALVDRLKKVCVTAASSLMSEDPLDERDPDDAREFVRHCSFLQTRHGSFETRIQLPETFQLGRRLDNQEGTPSREAANLMLNTFSVVFDEIVAKVDNIYTREYIESISGSIHIPLIRNVALMLRDTDFREYEFRFLGGELQKVLTPPRLDRRDIEHVYDYVKFMRAELASGIPVDVRGTVTELRSKDIKSSNNHVRVRGYDVNTRRELELALSLGRAGYLDAVTAHGRGQSVNVKGFARKLKSYYRVNELHLFELA